MKYKTIETEPSNTEEVKPPVEEVTEEPKSQENKITSVIKDVLAQIKAQCIAHMRCEKTAKHFADACEPLVNWLITTNPKGFKFPFIPEVEVVEIDCTEVQEAIIDLIAEINYAIEIAAKANEWIAVGCLQEAASELMEQPKKSEKDD